MAIAMQTRGIFASASLLLTASILWLVSISLAGEVRIPTGRLDDLGSQEFKIRESAEMELLEWGRSNPEEAMSEFLRQSQNAVDPEVRERCLDVLRTLVTDEYMKEGEGYIGIALAQKDEVVIVPGDPKERNAVRIVGVKVDTPGQLAGMRVNDLIVELEEEGWHGVEATPLFRERIRKMKPTSVARLTVLREGELIQLKVTLSRRPMMADMFFNGRETDMDAAERAAKEAYFQRWLSQKKTVK